MSRLEDLKQSISTLSYAEALELVIKNRNSRRVSKRVVKEKTVREKQEKKPRKATVKVPATFNVEDLSQSQAQTLLKLLQAMKTNSNK